MIKTPAPESDCARACENMARLGCEEAQPDEEGNGCVEVCETVEAQKEFTLNPKCRATKDSCESMSECDED